MVALRTRVRELEEENARLRGREEVCTKTHRVRVPVGGWGGKEVVEKLRRLEKMESEGRYLTPEQVQQVRRILDYLPSCATDMNSAEKVTTLYAANPLWDWLNEVRALLGVGEES